MIRKVIASDIPMVARWLFKGYASVVELSPVWSKAKLSVTYDRILTTLESWLSDKRVIMLRTDGGVIIGIVTEFWFSGDIFCEEAVFYVTPEWRGSEQAVELLKALDEEAKIRGCKGVHLDYLFGLKPFGFDAFADEHGFQRIGSCFIKVFD